MRKYYRKPVVEKSETYYQIKKAEREKKWVEIDRNGIWRLSRDQKKKRYLVEKNYSDPKLRETRNIKYHFILPYTSIESLFNS